MQAELALIAALRQGRTVAATARATPPLQLSRLRHADSGWPGFAACTVLHQAGILDGDCYDLSVTAGAATRLAVVAAGSTQVYRAGQAAQRTTLGAAAGATLAFLPSPVVLGRDADFTQFLTVTLSPDSRVILSDIFVPGRLHAGERWAFAQYRTSLAVHSDDGALLVAERAAITRPALTLGLAARPVVASLWLLGAGFAQHLAAVRACLADAWTGADTLPNNAGLAVRCLATGGPAAYERLVAAAQWATNLP